MQGSKRGWWIVAGLIVTAVMAVWWWHRPTASSGRSQLPHTATGVPELPARQRASQDTAPRSARIAETAAPPVSDGRTLRGTVSDAGGGPVAGARIDVAPLVAGADPDAPRQPR